MSEDSPNATCQRNASAAYIQHQSLKGEVHMETAVVDNLNGQSTSALLPSSAMI